MHGFTYLRISSNLKLTCKCTGGATKNRNWKSELIWSEKDGASGKDLPDPDIPVIPPSE
jgi:hypothetical protein